MVSRHSPYEGVLHEVVAHAGTLSLAGIVAEVIALDMERQARDVLQKRDALLLANGFDRRHVLRATASVTDRRGKDGLNRVGRAFFDPLHLPARDDRGRRSRARRAARTRRHGGDRRSGVTPA